jgi:hypothetical protein
LADVFWSTDLLACKLADLLVTLAGALLDRQ